jgi:uncharacterized protein YbaP (TraB family)
LRRLLVLFAVALAPLSSGAAADPLIWRVEGAGAKVFIVGSTPAAPADGRWRTAALQRAAAAAQEIWFVTPFGLPGPVTALRMLATIQTQGRLPDGQRLSHLLTPDGRARLARLGALFGLSFERLDRMTPWNAQITLALAARRRDGTIKGMPVERFVIAAAPKSAARRGFDNLEDDLKALIATPQSEQIYDLEEAMRRYEDPSLNERYGEAWAAGDEAWILKEREEPLKANAPATYRALQAAPRERWADQIAALSRGDKPVIVVVDAANLVGPDSLITRLRRRGIVVAEAAQGQ